MSPASTDPPENQQDTSPSNEYISKPEHHKSKHSNNKLITSDEETTGEETFNKERDHQSRPKRRTPPSERSKRSYSTSHRRHSLTPRLSQDIWKGFEKKKRKTPASSPDHTVCIQGKMPKSTPGIT